jgi:colanic acid biosynthesis glycosyl transferase WcaI
MRILVLGINYAPEPIGIAPCTTELCEWLQREGHTVDVVTAFPYYPAWKKRHEDRGRVFRNEEVHGVQLHRCWQYVPGKPSALKRMLHEASFAVTGLLRALVLPRADLCVVVCPPLVLGLTAWLVKVCRGTPYLVHVQDMQPDAAVALGMLKPGLLTDMLYRLESFIYRGASRVSGITRGMLQAFRRKGVPSAKLVLLANSISLPEENAGRSRGAFRAKHVFTTGEFLAVYSGNVGAKQGIDILFEAANGLQDSSVKLVVCGDGAGRDLLGGVSDRARESLLLLPLQARDAYERMLQDADCCIITQKHGAGSCFFPSKMLTALSFGRAIVAVADRESELSQVIERGGFGVVVEPGKPDELAAALVRLSENPEMVQEMGRLGRAYASRFESRRVHAGFEYVLREMKAPVDPRFAISKLVTAAPEGGVPYAAR